MKCYSKSIGVFALFILLATSVFAGENTPIGYWKTIDDMKGKAQGILKIWETADGSLEGRIVKIFPDPGDSENALCAKCKDERHNQPIQGMLVMWGLKNGKEQWSGGQILDPNTGNVYDVNMKVLPGGEKMQVRGYVGAPMFGRTQTWERTAGV